MRQDAEHYRRKSVHAAAERVLTHTFGAPVLLSEPQGVWVFPDECRQTIQRADVLEGPGGVPASVILKRINWPDAYDPHDLRPIGGSNGDSTAARRLLSEWTATRFLGSFPFNPPLSPCCYGGDLAEGIVILEDIGTGERLYDLLRGSDVEQARAALLGYAATLGSIHGATAGREAEDDGLWSESGPRTTTNRIIEAEQLPPLWRRLRELGDSLGVEWPVGADADVQRVVAAVREPGPFLALTHGDNFPANDMYANGCLRLYAFERAAFRHALFAGFVRPHLLPWQRYRFPEPLERRFEAIYRAELAKGCPDAADNVHYARTGLTMRAAWLLRAISWHLETAVESDSHWEGDLAEQERPICPTLRQRTLLILDSFAVAAARVGHLEAMGTAAHLLVERLRAVWQPVSIELQPFPVFAHLEEPNRTPNTEHLNT